MNLRRLFILVLCLAAAVSLWLMPARTQADPPGASFVQLTNDHAIDVRPAWSPDNRSIAFQSNLGGDAYHIYVMNTDGSNTHALTQGRADDRHPVWMPDGKSILYDSSDGERAEIWLASLADGSHKQITRLGKHASFASPSPDGQRISFYVFDGTMLNLWTARIDGSDAKPLTHGLASAENNQCTFACHQASWSLDGQTIAYAAGEEDTIWTISSGGGEPNRLIANGEDNHFPWFMADGRLGYITEHINPGQSYTDAWAYDLKTGKATILQGRMSPQGPFEWSSDNKKVLFHSPRSGEFEIYMVDLNAPSGVQALQGTPMPAQLAAGAGTPVAPVTNPATAQPVSANQSIFWVGAGALAVAALAVLGALAWYKRRR